MAIGIGDRQHEQLCVGAHTERLARDMNTGPAPGKLDGLHHPATRAASRVITLDEGDKVRVSVEAETRNQRGGGAREAENAFLPGLLQNGAWALLLGLSLVVRWPAAGFLVGAVLKT